MRDACGPFFLLGLFSMLRNTRSVDLSLPRKRARSSG